MDGLQRTCSLRNNTGLKGEPQRGDRTWLSAEQGVSLYGQSGPKWATEGDRMSGAVTPPQQGAHPGPASFFEREQGFLEKKRTLGLGKGKHQCLEDTGRGCEGAPRELGGEGIRAQE